MIGILPVILAASVLGAAPGKLQFSARIEPPKAQPGDKVELVLDCSLPAGWHIYSPDFKGTGIPTSIKLSGDAVAPAGALKFPAPTRKFDKDLGEEFLYHEGKFTFRQPLAVAAGAPPGKATVAGEISYMACSSSVCDPLARAKLSAELEVLAAAGEAPKAAPAVEPAKAPAEDPPAEKPAAEKIVALPDLAGKGGLKKAAGANHVAWKLRADPVKLPPGGHGELVIEYETSKGFHIYPPDHKGEVGKPLLLEFEKGLAQPEGTAKSDPPAKEIEEAGFKLRVLEGKGEIRYPFQLSPEVKAGKLALPIRLEFQVCGEGKCFDQSHQAEVEVEVDPAAEGLDPPAAAAAPGGAKAADGPKELGWLALIGLAIVSGLFTLLMPCTYPMIPITISFFTKQAEARHTSVLPLALAYGAGIVVDFILIGLIVGAPIQQFAAHPVINGIFAALFIVFGLSLLGLYEIRLPSAIQGLAGRTRGSQGYVGVFLLGTTFVIVSFTCSAPVIGVLLASGVNAKGPGQIIVGMTVFGLTMALPFVLLALAPAKARSLPRAGEWMHTLKVTLGFIELAAALKFVSQVDVVLNWQSLPRELFFYMVAAITVTTALYLFGLIRLRGESAEIGPLRMVWGLVFAMLAFYMIYAAHARGLNIVIEAFAPPYDARMAANGAAGPEKSATWTLVEDDFKRGLETAQKEKKLALINWTGIT